MGLDIINHLKNKDNSQLNHKEFNSQKVILNSSPRTIFIQAAGPCNSNCTFCSRPANYEFFNLDKHKERFSESLYPYISRAETLIFTGSGEFLLLPEAEGILDFFNDQFPHVEKQFSTNGSPLTRAIAEKIIKAPSKFTIHVSLHASNPLTHRVVTRSENFTKVRENLKYLLKLRTDRSKLEVRLIFVATTLNIDDLPDFIKLAADLGLDRVICYYNYIYVPAQKYLSCFFKQKTTNLILDRAQVLSRKLGMPIDLPPQFGLKQYPATGVCREPWSQLMTDSQGNVLPCDASEDCNLNIVNAASFMDEIWNSDYYQSLRRSLIKGEANCFQHCFRANPACVNDFSSHVIHRGAKGTIDIRWGDNF